MTTSSRTDHDRQHQLIAETLHEIRGDVKWLREHVDLIEERTGRLDERLGRIETAFEELVQHQSRHNEQTNTAVIELLELMRQHLRDQHGIVISP